MIGINKKYTTTTGGEVTLYTLEGMSAEYPIVGEVRFGSNQTIACRWTAEGVCQTLLANLVEVPIWEPSPELVAALRPGWIACDPDEGWWWYSKVPSRVSDGDWDFDPPLLDGEIYKLALINETMLPPINEQTMSQAFKIGNPE